MALYTFYPVKADGTSLTFAAFDLEDEVEVVRCAKLVLADHESAARVIVWREDREVLTYVRELERSFRPTEP